MPSNRNLTADCVLFLEAATIEAQFAGMPSTGHGIVVCASPSANSQKLFAAVYIDHDLPKFANARTSQQQQQQQQQHPQQQTQQSHQQQAAPALVLPAPPRGPPGGPAQPLSSQKYAQYIQQRVARAAQLQQQAQGTSGVNGLTQQQQANALGFLPGLPSAGVGAFGQSGGTIQPAFSTNPEMTAQFQALRQPQRLGGGQQPPSGLLNMNGANGSASAGSSGGAMTLDLLNTLLGAK
jgi:hypothetical protein